MSEESDRADKLARIHGLLETLVNNNKFEEARGAVMMLLIINEEYEDTYVENLAALFAIEQQAKHSETVVGNQLAKYLRIDTKPEAVKKAIEFIKAHNLKQQEAANAPA